SHTPQPPANQIPPTASLPADSPILISRAERGSPLAGTVLGEHLPPEAEEQLFVAAFEKVAAESQASPSSSPAADAPPNDRNPPASFRERAAHFAIYRLYEMANMDEYAGL